MAIIRVILAALLLCPPAAFAQVRGVPAGSRSARFRSPVRHVPGQLFNQNLNAAAIRKIYQSAQINLEASLKAVAEVPKVERTWDNTMGALQLAYDDFAEVMYPVGFLEVTSTNKEVRETIGKLDKEMAPWSASLAYREDIYQAIKDYAARNEPLAGERKRLLKDSLEGYERMGMSLPKKVKKRLQEISVALSEIGQEFSKELRNVADGLEVSPESLKGLSDDFIAGLKPGRRRNTVRLELDAPTAGRVLSLVEDPEVRRRYAFKYSNTGAPKNVKRLEMALKLRQEKAEIHGKKNFAELAIEQRMAKSPETVKKFLYRLKDSLTERARAEAAELLEEARRDDPSIEKVNSWDRGFYVRRLKIRKHQVDNEKIREYFPMQSVVEGTLATYEELLGLRFKEIKVQAWQKDVRLFEIRDQESGELVAHFFLDLFPREGKYDHMAAFSLAKGRRLPDGSYRKPVSAVVGNFTKPTPGKPSLLSHGEVKTFFHEFGHIMHQTLTKAELSDYSGSAVARDFVEAPSQMMENFIWNETVLRRLSSHYKTGKTLPKKLFAQMLAARNFRSASATLGQIALAALDLAYHTVVPKSSTRVMNKIFMEIQGRRTTPGTHFQASFGHLMGGYSAGYYGYLWSRVYAQDIFSIFEENGVLSPEVGRRYRREILEWGSARDEDVSLEEFLERAPSNEAFLRYLGIDPGGV